MGREDDEKLKSKDKRIIQEAQELGGLRMEWFLTESGMPRIKIYEGA